MISAVPLRLSIQESTYFLTKTFPGKTSHFAQLTNLRILFHIQFSVPGTHTPLQPITKAERAKTKIKKHNAKSESVTKSLIPYWKLSPAVAQLNAAVLQSSSSSKGECTRCTSSPSTSTETLRLWTLAHICSSATFVFSLEAFQLRTWWTGKELY